MIGGKPKIPGHPKRPRSIILRQLGLCPKTHRPAHKLLPNNQLLGNAAAERGFFRCLKELRQLEKQVQAEVPAVDEETFQKTLASFFQMEKQLARIEARHAELEPLPSSMPPEPVRFDLFPAGRWWGGRADLDRPASLSGPGDV
jgi:hypothetical protein